MEQDNQELKDEFEQLFTQLFKETSKTEEMNGELMVLSILNAPYSAIFDSCSLNDEIPAYNRYTRYKSLVCKGTKNIFNEQTDYLHQLSSYLSENPNAFLAGYIGYDIKNEIEVLSSKTPNYTHALPSVLFEVEPLLMDAKLTFRPTNGKHKEILFKARTSKQEYINTVEQIRNHIKKGDVYELNYCIEFYAENIDLDIFNFYTHFREVAQAPFQCFMRVEDIYIFSASMERFLQKNDSELIIQPIKGTNKREQDCELNKTQMLNLASNPKERAENIMIVDLTRSDLAKCSEVGTVKVEELCKVYPFQFVNQMISTITAQAKQGSILTDVLKATFPMGSMTGAPKIKAMQLIDEYESTQRGIYSGAIGYIQGNNADFSVGIRTFVYNKKTKYLSLQVGSAITYDSNPEEEYDECLLKINRLLSGINGKIIA